MNKSNSSANSTQKKSPQKESNQPLVTELSFETMETLNGGRGGKAKWKSAF